jgi:glucosamine 6-phosphate synthetase-like amidotransferase/phosphosugar isomerase protein
MFLLLNDEHRSQVLSNILQVKERGATTIVITNVPDLSSLIDETKMDFVIELPPANKMQVFGALQAVIPLQMICYLTTIKKGLVPDQQLH